MGGVLRAIVSPLSIIDKDLGKLSLQIVAVAAMFVPGGQPVAAAAALALATLYRPKGPKPEQQERSIKTPIPPRVSAYGRVRLYGAYILFTTDNEGFAVDAWAFHDGQIDAIEARYLGDKVVTLNGSDYVLSGVDGEFGDGDTIQVITRLGLPTETAISELITRLPGIWTSAHRGDGVVTGAMITKAVKSKNYSKVFPNGGPDANQLSLVIRAQKVFDWRDEAQDIEDPSTWEWSENSALATAHYLMTHMSKDWETHFLPTLDYWTAFADDCDVAMPLKGGGTEPRYRVAMAHKHIEQHKVVLGNLLATCDGFISPRSDGALLAYSGRYIEPDEADTIGPAEIVSYSMDDGIVDEDQINEITISYLSGAHDYVNVDATPWRDEGAISASGEEKSTALEAPVPSHAQGRRLAKRLIFKTMAPYRGTITTNAKGRKVLGKRFIPLHIEEAGAVFYSGPAEVIRMRRNASSGGVTFDWISADPNVDNWNPVTEEGDPAPVGTTPTIDPLDAPIIDDITAGDDGAALDVIGPDRPDLTWYVHWRVVGASSWGPDQEYPDIDDTPAVQLVIGGLPVGSEVEFEVAYQVGDGRVSPFSAPESITLDEIEYDGGGA